MKWIVAVTLIVYSAQAIGVSQLNPEPTHVIYSLRAQEAVATVQTARDEYRIAKCRFANRTLSGRPVIVPELCEFLSRRALSQRQLQQFIGFLTERLAAKYWYADYGRYIGINIAAMGYFIAFSHLLSTLFRPITLTQDIVEAAERAAARLPVVDVFTRVPRTKTYIAGGLAWGVIIGFAFVHLLNRGKSFDMMIRALNDSRGSSTQMIDVYRGTWALFLETLQATLVQFEQALEPTQKG